ncbi:YraN family protein [Moraxella porci]|uniref:YraN family protein n=1 Tax=Moraxella porci TaxID=1288392 RepID=UPI0024473DC0|nr:YraN family protein [Moraxella porci]MDH2273799.1 YraN family protein [Moraxella porci]
MGQSAKSAKTAKQRQGDAFECQAVEILLEQGYQIVATNYTAPKLGEIDIIATCSVLERGVLVPCVVFTEVRSRKASDFGTAIESITPAKQAKIYRTAEHFLAKHEGYAKMATRFDVIAFDIHQDGTVTQDWLISAF